MAYQKPFDELKSKRARRLRQKAMSGLNATEGALGIQPLENVYPLPKRGRGTGQGSKKTQFKQGNPGTPDPVAAAAIGQAAAAARGTRLTEEQKRAMAQRAGITPLEYLIFLLRDEAAPTGLKIEAAKAAAPYMHRRMPIAIEGGDADKPLRLDAMALKSLSRTELATLRVLLMKTGLVKVPDPTDVAERLLAGRVAHPIDATGQPVDDAEGVDDAADSGPTGDVGED